MLAMRLPRDAFFSYATAALLMGAPLPYLLERDERVHVTVAAPRRAPHGKGLAGHSRFVAEHDVRTTRGIRHASPERVWCELANHLTLTDLVAVGDHLIHHRSPWTTRTKLSERVQLGDPISRSRQLAAALALLDERAESRPESILRVILALSDLPGPLINRRIVVTTAGSGIRTDFAYRAQKLVIEYQGDYHRARSQWRADMTRRTRLEVDGWTVMELNWDDLQNPAELVARIRRGLARRS